MRLGHHCFNLTMPYLMIMYCENVLYDNDRTKVLLYRDDISSSRNKSTIMQQFLACVIISAEIYYIILP